MAYQGISRDTLPHLDGAVVAAPGEVTASVLYGPPAGYAEDHYFVSGTVKGTAYKTILVVIRPEAMADASGIVVMEPWHPWGGWTLYPKVAEYIVRSSHSAAIILSSPETLENAIRPQNPDLYASLSLPDTPITVSEVTAQAGALLRAGAVPGVAPRKMILGGHSIEGFWTGHYIEQAHNNARLDGAPIYDGYLPSARALRYVSGPVPDVDVPVIELQGESEVIRYFPRGMSSIVHRRDDATFYRLYEVAGMPHVGTRNGANADETASLRCVSDNWSSFPVNEVFNVSLDNLVQWVDKGVPAPAAPRIETTDGGRVIVRDDHGNAKGGLRTSPLEVPIATVHATNGSESSAAVQAAGRGRCDWYAWDEPFSHAKLASLYRTHDDYVSRVKASLDQLVASHWILAEDAVGLREEAAKAEVP